MSIGDVALGVEEARIKRIGTVNVHVSDKTQRIPQLFRPQTQSIPPQLIHPRLRPQTQSIPPADPTTSVPTRRANVIPTGERADYTISIELNCDEYDVVDTTLEERILITIGGDAVILSSDVINDMVVLTVPLADDESMELLICIVCACACALFYWRQRTASKEPEQQLEKYQTSTAGIANVQETGAAHIGGMQVTETKAAVIKERDNGSMNDDNGMNDDDPETDSDGMYDEPHQNVTGGGPYNAQTKGGNAETTGNTSVQCCVDCGLVKMGTVYDDG
eukprot:716790_1